MNNSERILIAPIRSIPKAFSEPFQKINAAFKVLGAIANMKGTGGIVIVKSGDNWIVDASNVTGLPTGYTFEEFTICDSGTPATRWWPTWTSNPEA